MAASGDRRESISTTSSRPSRRQSQTSSPLVRWGRMHRTWELPLLLRSRPPSRLPGAPCASVSCRPRQPRISSSRPTRSPPCFQDDASWRRTRRHPSDWTVLMPRRLQNHASGGRPLVGRLFELFGLSWLCNLNFAGLTVVESPPHLG